MKETLEVEAERRHGAHRALTQREIDQRVFDLYDEYCHGGIDRREFLKRAAAICVGGLAMSEEESRPLMDYLIEH